MGMEKRPGVKVELICSRCGIKFQRPRCTIRKDQKEIFCSRLCLKKSPEEVAATRKRCAEEWRLKNPKRVRYNAKLWRERNEEKVKAWKKRDWQKHGRKYLEKSREFRKNNPDIVRAKDREYYWKNAKHIRLYSKELRNRKPEARQRYSQTFWTTKRDSAIWSRSKKSAKNAKVGFDLTKEWIKVRLDRGVCELSGIPFDMEGKRTANSPSIDRIKAGGSYTQDNCRLILWSLNRALSNYGEEYMCEVFMKILKMRGTV